MHIILWMYMKYKWRTDLLYFKHFLPNKKSTSASATCISSKCGGGAVITVCNVLANISVADYMPLSSLLKTIKINSSVKCRQCIKIAVVEKYLVPITAGSNVPSTRGQYAADCVDRWHAIHKCRSATHQWQPHLSQILLQKYSKKCNIFLLIMDSRGGGATAPCHTFFESSHRADVKL